MRRRTGLIIASCLVAGGFALGCSEILGITELSPPDGGATDGGTHPMDATMPDQSTPPQEDAACAPGCPAATPVCLDNMCKECVPNAVRCSPAGVPQQCNPGGNWVGLTSTPCMGGTPVCLAGQCVECQPGATMCADAGSAFASCTPQGIWQYQGCICDDGQCQQWPTGAMGDCHYEAGSTTTLAAGTTLDCQTLELDTGATLILAQADAGAAWTIVGVRGDALINGTLKGSIDSTGTTFTVTGQAPAADGGAGEPLTLTLVQGQGGQGGSTGWTCASGIAPGGSPAFGNGGGGAGDTFTTTDTPLSAGSTMCPACGAVDISDAGNPGGDATLDAGGGGASSQSGTAGGPGAATFGAAGGPGVGGALGGSSGGGGGFRGRHGGLVYLKVLGTLSGSGTIDLSGQPGGAGGFGLPILPQPGPFCPPATIEFLDESGGGGGGGGAGGAGGALVLRYDGDASALPQVKVAGGSGGAPITNGGNANAASGEAGAPGAFDAGPVQ